MPGVGRRRFVLDNDVPISVRRLLVSAGHDCWTAADAGLAGKDSALDDDISVYAQGKGACVVTHDREFTSRRKKNTFGQHIRLKCEQPDAAEILEEWLPEILPFLEGREDIVLEVSRDAGVKAFGSWE